MEDNFKIEIISPEKIIFSDEVNMVTIPSYEGDMSILKNHISIITFLKPGKLVDLESTIKGFDAICKGEYDHLPEAAFYMVGTIEEVIEKAEKMAKDAAA